MHFSTPLRFSVLGPLRAWRRDDELDLGPRQQRLVLGLLLAHTGKHVGRHEFVDILWDGEAPASGLNSVHRYIGALRRLLDPGLPSRAPGQWLLRHGDSYQLTLPQGSIDLMEFRTSVDAARQASAEGDLERAVSHYVTALQLHHGRCVPAGGSVRHLAFAAVDREVALAAREAAEAAVAVNRASAVLPVLRPVAEVNPLDEALQAQLMLLLAADGKQSEAFELYEGKKDSLISELGVDPGPELRGAHDQVLRMTPNTARSQAEPLEPWLRPAQLPHDLAIFTGRSHELSEIHTMVDDWRAHSSGPGVFVVDGMPGVGKTAFTVHLAHQVADEFPDGQIYLNLHGFDTEAALTPAAALRSVLISLGIPVRRLPDEVIALAALYRSVLAERRILVLLDNARDASQVQMLVPGGRECLVLVTSRQRLPSLSINDCAFHLTLGLPTYQEAREGFLRRIGVTPGETVAAAADQIVEICHRLPLALTIIAARLNGRPGRLISIASEMNDSPESLDALTHHGSIDIRTVFSWSYRALTTPAAHLFRILATHVWSDFSLAKAARLARLEPKETSTLLDELTTAHLLVDRGPQRYRFHDLLQRYARNLTPVVAMD